MSEYPVIDLRSAERFSAAHIKGSFSFPSTMIASISHELPPRGARLVLAYDDPAQCALFRTHFKDFYSVQQEVFLGHHDVHDALSSSAAPSDPSPPTPTLSSQFRHAQLESGPFDLKTMHLWKPSLVVSSFLSQTSDVHSVLDLGCGLGRNAVFAALHGVDRVVGIDNRKELVDKMRAFALRYGVGDAVSGITGDVCKMDSLYAQEPFDAVFCIRFLPRAFLKSGCLLQKLTMPGSYFVLEHFHVSCGHPSKPEQKISNGETIDLIGGPAHWQLMSETESQIEDGRVVLHVVCKRIA
eukprot:ANDGO_05384.mRNA.1 methyltransferase domain containing protein